MDRTGDGMVQTKKFAKPRCGKKGRKGCKGTEAGQVLAADPPLLDSEEELTLAEPDIESDEEEATNSKDGGGGCQVDKVTITKFQVVGHGRGDIDLMFAELAVNLCGGGSSGSNCGKTKKEPTK